MNRSLALIIVTIMFSFCAADVVGQTTETSPPVDAETPETQSHAGNDPKIVICTTPEQFAFPQRWLDKPDDYSASTVHPHDAARIEEIAEIAIAKYPGDVLAEHLEAIRFVTELRIDAMRYGGTNANEQLYISVGRMNSLVSDQKIERAIHHEIAHVLFDNHSSSFNRVAWNSINPDDHEYVGSGREALKQGTSGKSTEELDQQGFVTEYATASLEEDFCEVAAVLMTNNQDFWSRTEWFPRLALKAYAAICFYNSIHSEFDISYFRSLKTGRLAHIGEPLDAATIATLSRDEVMKALTRCARNRIIAGDYQAHDTIKALNTEFKLLMEALKRYRPNREPAPTTQP